MTSMEPRKQRPGKNLCRCERVCRQPLPVCVHQPVKTLVPTINQPSLLEILEGNIQLKVSIGQKAFVYADVSLIHQNGWLYYDRDQNGDRVKIDDHDVSTLRPFIVPSELYVSVAPKTGSICSSGKSESSGDQALRSIPPT